MSLELSPVITARKKVYTGGYTYFNLNEKFFGGFIDPVLNLDHFTMSERAFPPRPNAGFSIATYLFENSSGSVKAQDHLHPGDAIQISPGGFHWMTTGKGLMHEEIPARSGVGCEGIQLFVNLTPEGKKLEPLVFHLEPKQIPEWSPNPSVRVRVLSGRYSGVKSPLALPEDFTFLDVSLKMKMSFQVRVLSGSGVLIYVLSGLLRISGGDQISLLEKYQAIGAKTDDKERELFIEAREDAQFLVMSGKSIGEPIVAHGPFVMNTNREIEEAVKAYQRGEMGRLSPLSEDGSDI